jgi:hypothetical protein
MHSQCNAVSGGEAGQIDEEIGKLYYFHKD